MGLIKAGLSALSSTLSDQWKDYFYCEALPADVLVRKGKNKGKGSDNIISNGSAIAVADGQCMIIVDQGKVAEICAEPGEFVFDTSSEPSIFSGNLGESILESFKTLGRRFTFGGITAKDQRVYYINIKEIPDNKFGTPNPVPFRVVDSRIGLDIDVSLRANGVYSYKIADPILFYTNVCGNISSEYTRSEIEAQLKTEFISALQPSFGKLSDLEMRPNQIVNHMPELEAALNETLSTKWASLRGIKVVSVALGSVTLPEEDQELIKTAQKTAMMKDPTMAAATIVSAQADAMRAAAENANGAAMGFMGMNMAQASGGMNANALFEMGAQKKEEAAQAPAVPAGSWKCSCGAVVSGKFCSECGAKKPDTKWFCPECGAENNGKFCPQCGTKKPE